MKTWGSAVIVIAAALCGSQAGASNPEFLYPTDSDEWVDENRNFEWTEVPGADAYYLKIGSQKGAADIVNTGEIQLQKFPILDLPRNRVLHGSIHARVNGKWRSQYIQFRLGLHWIYPKNNAINVSTGLPFSWASDDRVQQFRLMIGEEENSNDILDSGWIRDNKYFVPTHLPADRPLHGTLYFRTKENQTHKIQTVFEGSFSFIRPENHRSYSSPQDFNFKWTPVGPEFTYKISIGTYPNDQSIVDWTETEEDNIWVPRSRIPNDQYVHATTLVYEKNSLKLVKRADTLIWIGAQSPELEWLHPVQDAVKHEASSGFGWKMHPLAQHYEILLKKDGAVLYSSGPIKSLRHFIPVDRAGRYDLVLRAMTGFSVIENQRNIYLKKFSPSPAAYWEAVKSSTFRIFGSAHDNLADFLPRTGSLLSELLFGESYFANCLNMASAVHEAVSDMNLRIVNPNVQMETMSSAFMLNGFEGHTFVSLSDPESNKRVIVDPTFGWLSRDTTGAISEPEDLQRATLRGDWKGIASEFLNPKGLQMLKDYYIPFPLLFLNLQPFPNDPAQAQSPFAFLEEVPEIPTNKNGDWVFQSNSGEWLSVRVNGFDIKDPLKPLAPWGLYRVLSGRNIEITTSIPPDLKVYRVKDFSTDF